ncbi:MAG: T9SS type A sorting domain-containing protein [Chitinophagales bacterium]
MFSRIISVAQPGTVDWGAYINSNLTGDEFIEQIITEQSGTTFYIYAVGISYSSSGTINYCSTNPAIGNGDVFVVKYTDNGSNLTQNWIKFIGSDGSSPCTGCDNYDWGYCMTIDHDGSNTFVYVGGNMLGANTTYSIPTACNICASSPYQSQRKDSWDAFLAKLDGSNGNMVAWTYFGGKGTKTDCNATTKDIIMGIAVKGSGTNPHDLYVVGYTESLYNPSGCQAQGLCPSGTCGATVWDNSSNNGGDAFIAVFDNCLHTLKYFTYYNCDLSAKPAGQDRLRGINFDTPTSGEPNLYVSGTTQSAQGIAYGGNIFQSAPGSTDDDGFVAKWVWDNSLPGYAPTTGWSTYVGGSQGDKGRQITIKKDASGSASYVYADFWCQYQMTLVPVFNASNGFQTDNNSIGVEDCYIIKLDASDGHRIWSTWYGGNAGDYPNGLKIYPGFCGEQYVAIAGVTASSSNFISQYSGSGKLKSTLTGCRDGFFALLRDNGNSVALSYATYLGGSGEEWYGPPQYQIGNCSANCPDGCLYSDIFNGYGPFISTGGDLFNKYAFVSFSTNSSTITDNVGSINYKGATYTSGSQINCPKGSCLHDNFDAFILKWKLGAPEGCAKLSSEEIFELDYSISPNPANASLVIDFSQPVQLDNICILNTLGEVAFQKKFFSDQTSFTINVQELPSGIYFLQLQNESWCTIRKFVKQ